MQSLLEDTITAIATAPGISAIGIVRLNGPDSFRIASQLFHPMHGKSEIESHHLQYGHILSHDGQQLDEVLITFMQAPNTYTREDLVEIHCHGNPYILKRVLEEAIHLGARMANPGEMTMRAFLNGRIDLTQAEAVMDTVQAQTDAGLQVALQQLKGKLSTELQPARQAILNTLTKIEASIDFPEEDVPTPTESDLAPDLRAAMEKIDRILAGAERGRILRQGLRTAIIGRPNVGKSSLLNALVRTDRAIVTPIAGTTRDTVEEIINVQGVPVHLIDTAGITETSDPVEVIGVERSRKAVETADVVMLVLDHSQPVTAEDTEVCRWLEEHYPQKPLITVLNKGDLPGSIHLQELKLVDGAITVPASAITSQGIEEIEHAILELAGGLETSADTEIIISNTRHRDALNRCRDHLEASLSTLAGRLPLDFVAIDLHAALQAIGEVTGESVSEDLLHSIFASFCIGK